MHDPYGIYNSVVDRESVRTPAFHYETANVPVEYPYSVNTSEGVEYSILDIIVNVVHRVEHGSYSSYADNPEDYYDTYTVVAWDVLSVKDEYGNEVNIETMLTPEQVEDYNQFISAFVED